MIVPFVPQAFTIVLTMLPPAKRAIAVRDDERTRPRHNGQWTTIREPITGSGGERPKNRRRGHSAPVGFR
jgi:hypothetical protein